MVMTPVHVECPYDSRCWSPLCRLAEWLLLILGTHKTTIIRVSKVVINENLVLPDLRKMLKSRIAIRGDLCALRLRVEFSHRQAFASEIAMFGANDVIKVHR